MRMPPLPADFIHARACKLKCEKILTRPKFFLHLRLLSLYYYFLSLNILLTPQFVGKQQGLLLYIYLSYHIHPKKETWRKSPMSLHIKYYLLSTIEILRIIPLRVMS